MRCSAVGARKVKFTKPDPSREDTEPRAVHLAGCRRSPASSNGAAGYLHSYYSSRPRVDWNKCGQAAVATLLDYHGLNPFGLEKPAYDAGDGCCHWDDGKIIDRIQEDFPPDNFLGLFGTTPNQLRNALTFFGLETKVDSSKNTRGGRKIWEEVKRSANSGSPVAVIMDMGKLGGRAFTAHWGIVYRVESPTVYLANCRNLDTVSEARFLRAFRCWFMPPKFNHCAVFSRLPA